MFSARLAKLKAVPKDEFDAYYIADMKSIHAKDEKAFAKEAVEGSSDFHDVRASNGFDREAAYRGAESVRFAVDAYARRASITALFSPFCVPIFALKQENSLVPANRDCNLGLRMVSRSLRFSASDGLHEPDCACSLTFMGTLTSTTNIERFYDKY